MPNWITWVVAIQLAAALEVNLFLHTKAKASVAILHPEPINRFEVSTGKVFDILNS
jgi:aspartate carbamoyltransferase catalytic subunit